MLFSELAHKQVQFSHYPALPSFAAITILNLGAFLEYGYRKRNSYLSDEKAHQHGSTLVPPASYPGVCAGFGCGMYSAHHFRVNHTHSMAEVVVSSNQKRKKFFGVFFFFFFSDTVLSFFQIFNFKSKSDRVLWLCQNLSMYELV